MILHDEHFEFTNIIRDHNINNWSWFGWVYTSLYGWMADPGELW